MQDKLSIDQIEKIGNTVIYLSSRVSELTKTKLLKLLFLIEEKSIKETGRPFFGLDFKVWQFGPVVEPIFQETTDTQTHIFKYYFIKNQFDEFEALRDFNDDEFSGNDIMLLDSIVAFARNKMAQDLVQITHAKDSLWRKAAIKYGIYEAFLQKKISRTDYSIDFSMLFEGQTDSYVFDRYMAYLENACFSRNFKELKRV